MNASRTVAAVAPATVVTNASRLKQMPASVRINNGALLGVIRQSLPVNFDVIVVCALSSILQHLRHRRYEGSVSATIRLRWDYFQQWILLWSLVVISIIQWGLTHLFLCPGAVAFKRASVVVRAEGKVEPGPAGRQNAPSTPHSPPGMSGSEAPLGVISSTVPLEQGSDKPVSERMAYVCQDCGYVYDEEKPFEDVPDEYNCPRKPIFPYFRLHSLSTPTAHVLSWIMSLRLWLSMTFVGGFLVGFQSVLPRRRDSWCPTHRWARFWTQPRRTTPSLVAVGWRAAALQTRTKRIAQSWRCFCTVARRM